MSSPTDYANASGTICPACGTDNIPGTDSCHECGQSLIAFSDVAVATGESVESALLQQPLLQLEPKVPECVEPDTSLAEAISCLKGRKVGCLLVTGHGGELVGIFTERDVLYRVAGLIGNLNAVPVESLMTPSPTTLKPSDPINRALHLMAVHGFRHVPLVDEDGCPVGYISLRDIIRFMDANFIAD
ncbi:MAG: CBS domain-containing protein [Candidatus Latescibacterota bacterium]|nr:CBS domain-containing protein [Candidatus Latescibacterota bacterium]